MALTAVQRRALTHRLQDALGVITDRTAAQVARMWADVGGVTDADLEAFAKAVGPATTAAKDAAILTSSGFYATVLGLPPVAVLASEVPTAFDALAPFIVARKALGDGYPFDEALRMGGSAAQASTSDFVVSTSRRSGDVFLSNSGASALGWERIAEAGACLWCRARDGGIYDSSAAADYGHDRCRCAPVPVAG